MAWHPLYDLFAVDSSRWLFAFLLGGCADNLCLLLIVFRDSFRRISSRVVEFSAWMTATLRRVCDRVRGRDARVSLTMSRHRGPLR